MSDYLTLSIEKFVKYMKSERLVNSTIESYVHTIRCLSIIDTRLYRLTNIQIQDFILDSISESAQNLKISAIKKYYIVNHPRKRISVFIRPNKSKRIIEILSISEVWKIIDSIKHTKQKAIISCIYCHGLRALESINLKYSDIDKKRNLLIIRNGKGRKDRPVPLNKRWLKYLTKYAIKMGHTKEYDGYIFRPYTKSSIRNAIKLKAKKAGIRKNVYTHLLRDCYASHLYQQGVPLKTIQEILGHSDIKTTTKYIHISAINISGVELEMAS